MPKFAANLTMLYQEYPLLERIERAASAGFRGVEILYPYGEDIDAIKSALESRGIELVLFNVPSGNTAAGDRGIANDPRRADAYRAAVELAKDWRSDRMLRRLEALLVLADLEHSFLLSGSGELIEPDDGIIAVGSGGNFALAAARALLPEPNRTAREITQRSLEIAADICVFTNRNITVLELPGDGTGKK